ncbi:MAG TPA: D-alanine--D-alanine ligase family protein [Rhodothermales bacterium]|nr:D-alanine--D-alanine ligase family protein [Rhodothermales bacterium]
MDSLHVGLIYGGLSSEHEVSIVSARNVFAALLAEGHRVTPLYVARDGRWHVEAADTTALRDEGATPAAGEGTTLLAAAAGDASILAGADATALEPLGLDVVFPIIHGQNGEDGRLQGLLTMLGLPYVGPGVLGSAVCMDKEVTKRLLRDAGLPVVPFHVVRYGDRPAYDDVAADLGPTLFVKPANAGSSVGISKVESAEAFDRAIAEALVYDNKVLVEAAVTAREIESAVIGNEVPRVAVLGEIVSTAQFYTYEAKYIDASASRMEVPAPGIPDDVAERLRAMAAEAYRVLNCEGMARVDFFVTADHEAMINEVNTIPGFTSRSMFPVMWEHAGLPIGPLVSALLGYALDRHARDARLKTTR